MHGKQYSDEQNAAIRAVVREIVERDFRNTKAPAAEALGLSAASLGDFLNGKKGVGNKLLSALARYTGQSTAALLGEQPDSDEPQWGSLPGYRESEKSLRAEHPHRYSEALYKMGRRIPVPRRCPRSARARVRRAARVRPRPLAEHVQPRDRRCAGRAAR